jgi:hypothetical protein
MGLVKTHSEARREARLPSYAIRAAKWAGAAVAGLLLALGVQSAWTRIGRWISPPPRPIAEQIDSLVHLAASRGLSLQYQSTARLHPGGGLSHVFVFKPELRRQTITIPSSELRIYDVKSGRLQLAYRLRPLGRDAYSRSPWTFGIDVLNVSDLYSNGADEIVAALGLHAADAVPTFPVVVQWRAATNTYTAAPVMSRSARPALHGSRDWTRGYRTPMTLWNAGNPEERFASYHAEAVQVEPGKQPVLLGIFYAHALSRAEPRELEVNIWPLSGDSQGICSVGAKYPPPPLLMKVTDLASYDVYMSRAWIQVHSKVSCF